MKISNRGTCFYSDSDYIKATILKQIKINAMAFWIHVQYTNKTKKYDLFIYWSKIVCNLFFRIADPAVWRVAGHKNTDTQRHRHGTPGHILP
jgi:hypothetical protein